MLFVKLRQYPGFDRPHVEIPTDRLDWQAQGDVGRHVIKLFSDGEENIRLTRLEGATKIPRHEHPGGNEMFVLAGSIEDEHGRYEVGDWIRSPAGSIHQPWTEDGCVLYVKDGHLHGLSVRAAVESV